MNQYHKTNKVRDKYFSIINTQDKAYILGILLADGHLEKRRNAVSLSLSGKDDGRVVQQIANRLFIDTYYIHNDNHSEKNSKHQDRFHLWLTSKQMTRDLSRLGFTDNKSKDCQFDFKSIPSHLFPHFLRGFFDGDGSVFLTKYNSLNVHFVGLLNIIEYIREYLKSIGIRSGLYPCFSTDAVWELRFGNVHNVHKIYELMYKNAKLYLPRKKKKFEMGFVSLNSELKRTYTSQFSGVSFDKARNKWKVSTWNKNKPINIGRYNTEIDAARAYNQFVLDNKLNKELNKI